MSDVRERLALALDIGGAGDAEAFARRLAPWFGIAKVGMELYAEAGPDVIDRLHALGLAVFADLKFYDIPNTVERAARVAGRRGVEFLNFPAAGGTSMLEAGVKGLADGARAGGHPPPKALAVTVLTSEPDASAFPARLDAAVTAGCDGVVCSAHEITTVKERASGLGTMVPGIRLPGASHDDQARVATPADAIARGADWLVIGRAVTAATDPEATAETITRDVTDALARRARTR
ncbi:MAG TPA: orotidine-5'-phosphate decarboxylase [Acidimicrobiia bacterium]|nr:orotidine-5'-phosphate decarboxylase [Acidimicrobiia bacterium]